MPYNKALKRTNNSWLFAPSSHIYPTHYLPLSEVLGIQKEFSMTKYILGLVLGFTLVGCKSTPTQQYQDLKIIEADLLSQRWENLERSLPLYPVHYARAGKEGCATIEYVITPSYEIKDINVISSTKQGFAKQAIHNIKQWGWSKLDKGILREPIKTSTRFEFCLESADKHCAKKSFLQNSECSGEDLIYLIGSEIKRIK